ncbi:MAG: ATP-binding protein [Planctomycetota bacterium]|nr:ATP-binding protein [Planctomycetota bacterium]
MAFFAADPLWRAMFVRAAVAGLAVALASAAGFEWGVAAAVVVAAVMAFMLVQRVSPLRRRIVELAGEPSPGGDPNLAEMALRVDEAHQRLDQALRRAQLERDDLLGILEASSDGILVLGHHQRVELINGAARRLLNPPVDPLGRTLYEIAREPDLLDFAEALRRGEAPDPVRIEIAHSGTTRSVHVSGEMVPGPSMRSRGVIVLHDLTDMQHLERVRTDFVANVTHELRSPLASILGYAETLAADGLGGGDEPREHLDRILRNAKRLDDIIRDLIELSRLEHASTPELRSADPREVVAKVAADLRDLAKAKEIEIQVETSDLPPAVDMNPELVAQALANLVDNAVKYTPSGGRVTITGRLREGVSPDRRRLEIAVSDTGPGIPLEHRARIFERFYRVDTARSRELGGTGLGLAIVKHAAALHGGRVRLESEPGKGATFRLELPVA